MGRTIILCGACSDCTAAHPSRRHAEACKGVWHGPKEDDVLVCRCPWRTKEGAEMRAPTEDELLTFVERGLGVKPNSTQAKVVRKIVRAESAGTPTGGNGPLQREAAPAPKDEGRKVVRKVLKG